MIAELADTRTLLRQRKNPCLAYNVTLLKRVAEGAGHQEGESYLEGVV